MRKHYKYSNFDWFHMHNLYALFCETVFIGSPDGFIAEKFVNLCKKSNEGGCIQNAFIRFILCVQYDWY
jgi:hypothetical protein